MKKLTLLVVFLLAVSPGAFAKRGSKSKSVIRAAGGTSIEGFGFSIDASHDVGLDRLVPGYRIVNVAVVNSSFSILILNPEEDRWYVRTDGKKKIPAQVDLRHIDPKAWAEVPERARQLMAYPLVIPIGAQLAIDLFVPNDVKLEYLTEVGMQLASFNFVPFEIQVRAD